MRSVLAMMVLTGLLVTASLASAQPYALTPDSAFVTGCVPPSPCDCFVEIAGSVSGDFALQLIAPPLGPIYEYEVSNIAWIISTVPGTVTGSGMFVVDLAAQTQSLTLDLEVDGIAATHMSIGDVPLAPGFPSTIEIAVSHHVIGCFFDGFVIRATIGGADFRRGDCNGDGAHNIADPIATLERLFVPGSPPSACADACDANDDGLFNIADAISSLARLFGGAPPLPAPFATCGDDPTADGLICLSFASCP
ncbi:MAG: hypothetical protein ACKVX7_05405 [Planctomycetota bacterium]